MSALAILAAATLYCTATLPDGERSRFLLLPKRDTVEMVTGDGTFYVFRRNKIMSDAKYQVAAAQLTGEIRSSLMIDDKLRTQQTFVMHGARPVFVYGRCRK